MLHFVTFCQLTFLEGTTFVQLLYVRHWTFCQHFMLLVKFKCPQGALWTPQKMAFFGLKITIFHIWSQKSLVMTIYQEKIYFFYDLTYLHYTCSAIKEYDDFQGLLSQIYFGNFFPSFFVFVFATSHPTRPTTVIFSMQAQCDIERAKKIFFDHFHFLMILSKVFEFWTPFCVNKNMVVTTFQVRF